MKVLRGWRSRLYLPPGLARSGPGIGRDDSLLIIPQGSCYQRGEWVVLGGRGGSYCRTGRKYPRSHVLEHKTDWFLLSGLI